MKYRKLVLCLVLLTLLALMASCAPGSGSSSSEKPAGFLLGVWHGWIAPISLMWGLFNPAIRVYEPINTGWWYDFGFYIALVGGFGGISLVRRKK